MPDDARVRGLPVGEVLRRASPIPASTGPPTAAPVDVEGRDPSGRTLRVEVRGRTAAPSTVLLFLSSSCRGCAELWELVREDPMSGVAVVAVAREVPREDSAELGRLGAGGTVVLSESAWRHYGVHGPPFWVMIDRSADAVVAEGVALGAASVVADVERRVTGAAG